MYENILEKPLKPPDLYSLSIIAIKIVVSKNKRMYKQKREPPLQQNETTSF